MIDERLDELIQRHLDGATTAEESADLERKLAMDPEAREYAEGLSRVAGILARVPSAEVPDELRDRVRAALESGAPRSAPTAGRRTSRPVLRWRDLLFAGAGAVAAVLVLAVSARWPERGGADTARMIGTIGASPVWDAARSLDDLRLDETWLAGRVRVVALDGVIGIELELEPEESVALDLRFDRDAFTIESFTVAPSPDTDVVLQAGRLHLDPVGRGRARLVLRPRGEAPSGAGFRLSLRGEGGVIERTLVARPPRED